MSTTPTSQRSPLWRRGPEAVGQAVRAAGRTLRSGVVYVGGLSRMLTAVGSRTAGWLLFMGVRVRFSSLVTQCVRVGVRAIPIIIITQLFIGIILALSLEPKLADYGQRELVANIIAYAMARELGPLISAVLLSGFAGASIAAELGTMVEGEEIKALRAHALDPIRFLVVPRVLATTVMLVGLTVIANIAGVLGGVLMAGTVLDIRLGLYMDITQGAITTSDYLTGLFKAAVFGLIVAALACYEGLNVRGGAAGVGQATTTTVVKSIVAIIAADAVFTAVFYTLGW